MSILDEINACIAREIIEQNRAGANCRARYRTALTPGWDIITNLKEIDQPCRGIWRTPHLDVSQFFAAPDDVPMGMFEEASTACDIEARSWRLLRIFPDPFDYRHRQLPIGILRKSPEAEKQDDIFAPLVREGMGPERGHLVEAIIGSSPREIARFCEELLKIEPQLGSMVLAKKFREAKRLASDVILTPWPRQTSPDRVYIPPFLASVLLAEMQRLAQNVCSQIIVSFFRDGTEATIATVVQKCMSYQKKQDARRKASDLYDPAIAQQIAYAPFQTRLHQFQLSSDPDLGLQRVYDTSRGIFRELARHGEPLVDFITGLHPYSPSPALAKSVSAHVRWLPDRKAKKGSRAHNADNSMRFHGMDWYDHAVLGLAQIHHAAREWNHRYCPENPWPHQTSGSVWGLQQAIARIPYFWLETAHPKAFEREANKLCRARERNSKRCKSDCAPRKAQEPAIDGGLKTDKPAKGRRLIDELAVFDDPTVKIKDYQVTRARKRAAEKPPHGYPGYSAQYRPHLWLNHDDDDIGFWIGREREICSSLCPLADLKISSLKATIAYQALLTHIERYRDTAPSLSAKVAQNLAMIPSSYAGDPMHIREQARRKKRQKAKSGFGRGTTIGSARQTPDHADDGSRQP